MCVTLHCIKLVFLEQGFLTGGGGGNVPHGGNIGNSGGGGGGESV